jgi:predicted DNA-binding transcriptional regulator AlpA
MNNDSLLDVNAVAALLVVKPSTVRSYHKRGQMPKADHYFGRSPVWNKGTIEGWTSSRKIKATT